MARRETPTEYTPNPVPAPGRGESAETYVERLAPFLQDEFSRIRDYFNQLPIIRPMYDAPRAPFTGMTVLAGIGGWDPGGGFGIYIYLSGFGWYKSTLTGPYQQG
jgi:hypothetical protein